MKRVFLVLVFVRGLCSAQLVDPPEVAALPAWPADGKLPPSLERKHIFHDLATGELVVSYPSPAEPGHRTTFRFWLPNRVEPVISVEIAATEPKIYSYTYTLHNGPGARTPILSWSVVGPPDDPQLRVSHPEWRGVNGQILAAPQAMVPGVANGAHLFWSNWSDPLRIGGTGKGFQLVSSYRPGLSTAYAVGDGVLMVPADLTDEVDEELLPFQRVQIWWRPVLTIGPRFAPSMSRGDIAAHFRDELQAVIAAGNLDGRSAYFRELIAGLENSLESGAEPKVNAQPRPGMELEVARALHLALSPDGEGPVR